MADTTLQVNAPMESSAGAGRRRNWWTIGRKITVATTLSITAGLAVMIWFAASLQTENMVEVSDTAAVDITELMAVQMGGAIRFNQAAAIEAVYNGQAEAENSMIAGLLAINADGEEVAALGEDLEGQFDLDLVEFRTSDTVSTIDEGSHLIVAAPVHFGNDNARVGTLIVGWSHALIDAQAASSTWSVATTAAVIVVLLVGLLTILLRRIVSGPLRRLEDAMSRLAGGDIEVAVPSTDRGDEIGDMAQAVQVFKDNAIEMRRLESERRADQERATAEKRRTMDGLANSFETTVKHIVDGVIGGLDDMQDSAQSMSGLADQTSRESTEVAAAAEQATTSRHEDIGAAWLARCFGPEVTEPIKLHVAAKRYLCAVDPDYFESLSPASRRSLELQGGPMTASGIATFKANPHYADAVALRRFDDAGKVKGRAVPPLERYRPVLERLLVAPATAA